MWSTHPANHDREENAKEVYIPSQIDEVSAWTLFKNKDLISQQVTQNLLQDAHNEKSLTPESKAESIKAVDEDYEFEFFRPKYHGVYLYGRRLCLTASSIDQMKGDLPSRDQLAPMFEALYPETLGDSIVQLNRLKMEIAHLKGIEDGTLEATENQITYQGEIINRRQLPEWIQKVEAERDAVVAELEQHDRLCRATHSVAAHFLGNGWEAYHDSLMRLLHYAEHSLAELEDALSHLGRLTEVTLAGNVSESKINAIVESANDVHKVMQDLESQRSELKLPSKVRNQKAVKNYLEEFKFELPPADRGNIQQWVSVVESWANSFGDPLMRLREASLAQLLKTEKVIKRIHIGKMPNDAAPKPAKTPNTYRMLLPGSERPKAELGWWARFKLADGLFASVSRFVVAASIVLACVLTGAFVGGSTVYVYNGLSIPVTVAINELDPVNLQPGWHKKISIGTTRQAHIETRATGGQLIEEFDENTDIGYSSFIYNVAGSSAMIEWSAVYWDAVQKPPVDLGFPKWRNSSARHIFEEPPAQVKIEGSGATRSVLSVVKKMSPIPPFVEIQSAQSIEEEASVISVHILWDNSNDRNYGNWCALAISLDDFQSLAEQRLNKDPENVPLLRTLQEYARESAPEILDEHQKFAESFPDNPDLQYIAVRAMKDGPEQDEKFLSLYRKFPNNGWINQAVAYIFASQDQWRRSFECFRKSYQQGIEVEANGLNAARIRRYLGDETPANLRSFNQSFFYRMFLDLESGRGLQASPEITYSLLKKGDIEKASANTRGDRTLVTLVGCSSNASRPMIEKALSLDPSTESSITNLIYLTALAFKNKKPTRPYISALEQLVDSRESDYPEILNGLIENGPTPELAEKIQKILLRDRAVLTAAAIMMYPDDCPESWFKIANQMLFSNERPYLGEPQP
ncbi:MAG: hypothetical protein AAF939_05690 [Planctomycetota bacterium]